MKEWDPSAEEASESPDPPAEARWSTRSANLVFERLYYDYQLALREVHGDEVRRVNELQDRCSREIQSAQADASRSAQEAYDNYLVAYRRAQSNAEETPEAEVQQAYRHYVRVYEEGQQAARKVYADAVRSYQREIENIQDEVRQAWRVAFRDYIQGMQRSWAEIDLDTISGVALAAIAQTMIAAATSEQSAEQASGGRR
jgi:hypothetical protein